MRRISRARSVEPSLSTVRLLRLSTLSPNGHPRRRQDESRAPAEQPLPVRGGEGVSAGDLVPNQRGTSMPSKVMHAKVCTDLHAARVSASPAGDQTPGRDSRRRRRTAGRGHGGPVTACCAGCGHVGPHIDCHRLLLAAAAGGDSVLDATSRGEVLTRAFGSRGCWSIGLVGTARRGHDDPSASRQSAGPAPPEESDAMTTTDTLRAERPRLTRLAGRLLRDGTEAEDGHASRSAGVLGPSPRRIDGKCSTMSAMRRSPCPGAHRRRRNPDGRPACGVVKQVADPVEPGQRHRRKHGCRVVGERRPGVPGWVRSGGPAPRKARGGAAFACRSPAGAAAGRRPPRRERPRRASGPPARGARPVRGRYAAWFPVDGPAR
jgi:hypothetical protein